MIAVPDCFSARDGLDLLKAAQQAAYHQGGYNPARLPIEQAIDDPDRAGLDVPPAAMFWTDGPTYCKGSYQHSQVKQLVDALGEWTPPETFEEPTLGAYGARMMTPQQPGAPAPAVPLRRIEEIKSGIGGFFGEVWFWVKCAAVVGAILLAVYVVRTFRAGAA